MAEPCGCRIVFPEPGEGFFVTSNTGQEWAPSQPYIERCPLHAAVDDLLAAAKFVQEAHRPYREDMVRHALEATDAAIAKANFGTPRRRDDRPRRAHHKPGHRHAG